MGVIIQKVKPATLVNKYMGLKSGMNVSGFRGYQKAKNTKEITQYFHVGCSTSIKSFFLTKISQNQNAATIRSIMRLLIKIEIPYSSLITTC